jgi:hypothetical protein
MLDRSDIARSLIQRMDELYDRALSEGPLSLNEAWHGRFEALDRDVIVETSLGVLSGRLTGADLIEGFVLTIDGAELGLSVSDVLTLDVADRSTAGSAG